MVAKTRVAQCACGGVTATTVGEPDAVSLCHCLACQRRTGSPFGVGAYFPHSAVTLSGKTKTFVRKVEHTDRTITNHFCPECGTTIYWMADLRPNHIGIAVGNFADPAFRPPTRAVWAQHRHEWITLPPDTPSYPQAAS